MDIFNAFKFDLTNTDIVQLIKGIGAIIVTTLITLIGGVDNLVQTLFIMMLSDIALGVLGAIYQGKLKSRTFIEGLIRKAAMVLGIVVVTQLDSVANIFDLDGSVRDVSISLLIAYEVGSILENWSVLGLPMPEFIRTRFAKYTENNTNDNTDSEQ